MACYSITSLYNLISFQIQNEKNIIANFYWHFLNTKHCVKDILQDIPFIPPNKTFCL